MNLWYLIVAIVGIALILTPLINYFGYWWISMIITTIISAMMLDYVYAEYSADKRLEREKKLEGKG